MADETAVDLYWLPLGAGGHSVRLNGRVFEAVAARLAHRAPCDLYHSALEVRVPEGTYVIEMTPIPGGGGADRGVVAEGAVGSRLAGHLRIFRYEVRRWLGGERLARWLPLFRSRASTSTGCRWAQAAARSV